MVVDGAILRWKLLLCRLHSLEAEWINLSHILKIAYSHHWLTQLCRPLVGKPTPKAHNNCLTRFWPALLEKKMEEIGCICKVICEAKIYLFLLTFGTLPDVVHKYDLFAEFFWHLPTVQRFRLLCLDITVVGSLDPIWLRALDPHCAHCTGLQITGIRNLCYFILHNLVILVHLSKRLGDWIAYISVGIWQCRLYFFL